MSYKNISNTINYQVVSCLVLILQATTSSFAGLCGSKNSASIAPIVDLRDPREPDVRRDIPPVDVLAEYLAVTRITEAVPRTDTPFDHHSTDSDNSSYNRAVRAFRQYDRDLAHERRYTEQRLAISRRQQLAERIAIKRDSRARKFGLRPRASTL